MCVQGVEAKAVCQNWNGQIDGVANIEDWITYAHTGIAFTEPRHGLEFAELRHDENFIYEDVDDKAKLIEHAYSQQQRNYIAVVHVAL